MADSVEVLYDRSKVLQSNGCHGDALKELDKVIELAGKYKEQSESLKRLLSCAWNDRGHLKYLQVNFDDAMSDYTRAIELDKDFSVPYYNRGQIHYRMGRYKEAVDDLRQALSIDPGFEDAQKNLKQALQDWDHCDQKRITAKDL